jgi:predicted MFS family arabinose efflux permease
MSTALIAKPSATGRSSLLTGALLRLSVADFAAMCSFYLLLAVVPMYFGAHGLGEWGAGLSTGALMLASVAAEMVIPSVAAKVGYRRLLVVGLLLLGVPALALPAAPTLTGLLVVSVLRGVGFAVVVVCVGAIAASAVPEERRGEGLGMLGVVATLPAVIALPLGLWLVDVCGFAVVFAAGAATALVAIVPVRSLPEPPSEDDQAGGLLGCLSQREVLRPLVVFAATAVASGVVVTYLPSAAGGVAAPALLAQSAASALTRWLAGRHADRHGAGVCLAVVACSAGMLTAALTDNAVAVVAGMAVFGAGFGIAQSASLTTMLKQASRSQAGAVSAGWNAAYDLGWGGGALAFGVAISALGDSAGSALAALVVLTMVPLLRGRTATLGVHS